MRNEEQHIGQCLGSLLDQTFPKDAYEVLVVNGRSSDRSAEIVGYLQHKWPRLRLLDNPAAITPCGMNLGIRNSQAKIIIIAGAHTVYPSTFIEACVNCLEKTGADVVGGPVITVPANDGFSAKLVAATLSSSFGVGNARFRTDTQEGFVDVVPYGAFRREVLDRVGLYNEKLVRNQDVELYARIHAAGGRVYLSPELTTRYFPPPSFGQLLWQTFRGTRWHIRTVMENRAGLKLRHFVPTFFVLVLLALMFLLFFGSRSALTAIAVLLGLYWAVGTYYTTRLRSEYGILVALTMPLGCFFFHLIYGIGTLAGLGSLIRMFPSAQFWRNPE